MGTVWSGLDTETGRIIERKALVAVLAGEDAALVRASAKLVQYRKRGLFQFTLRSRT